MQQLMDIVAGLQQEHAEAAAKYEKMKSAGILLGKVRGAMDGLMALGDTVTQEDIIKASGKLVAGGLTPVAVAGLLSDMPPEGEALQAWVNSHDQQVRQREQQLELATNLARHQMGLAAAHVLQGHSVAGRAMAMNAAQSPDDEALPSASGSNPLAGSAMDAPSLTGAPSDAS